MSNANQLLDGRQTTIEFNNSLAKPDNSNNNNNTGGGGSNAELGPDNDDPVERVLVVLSTVLLFATLPVSIFFCAVIVPEYKRAVVFRLGRLVGVRGPGLVVVLPFVDSYTVLDMRTQSFALAKQEILTRDSVTIDIDAVVYYRIRDAKLAVCNVTQQQWSTQMLAATTLRNILGTKSLSEILSDRHSIGDSIRETLDNVTESWGTQVERIEIRDVQLPNQMRRAMAAEAEASREARAKLINAEGEQRASCALRDAAATMSAAPQAIQLRYLQTLHSIAAEKNSTIIFPLPLDIVSAFLGKRSASRSAELGSSEVTQV